MKIDFVRCHAVLALVCVFPLAKAEEVLKKAQAKAEADARTTLDAWEKNHRSKIDASLKAQGYMG